MNKTQTVEDDALNAMAKELDKNGLKIIREIEKKQTVEDIDLQLAMCQSMAEVSDECINRLGVVRNMLEDLVLTVSPKNNTKVSGVEERLDKELNLNHHWWMARAMSKYNVSKEVAELILEDMSMVLEDKQEDMKRTIHSEIKANNEKLLKKIVDSGYDDFNGTCDYKVIAKEAIKLLGEL